MYDAFVKGASEIRLKSQCFDTGFNRYRKIYAGNVMLWTGPQIPSPRYFPEKQMSSKEDKHIQSVFEIVNFAFIQ